ncbi:hypothetical protein TRIUR3_08315 [Triticum urartu]|uniref:Cysteine-rich transmembrane CYSTM domain-containing protein n=1 Tax=Triticum urartu TaxID=4572 RepID=M8AEM6_TRIUA|nr:uncharacterized protein LOC119316580 [Triticum dicoccoides]XP_048537264.1 protein CADMIUM TOLERANCE 4-like [Triticum urartu]XP_048567931.1 protein CADMIUM TOLERANCE 4-like [Triticum urartu]EMS59049.1 hypothetical protein TRIUR3_08315 [Triticum urartu]
MTKQKQEQAATPSPSPALFSLHPTLFFLFSSLDSNFQFTPAPSKRQPATTKADEDEPSHSQGDDGRPTAMDHARKRHQEKGFFYDCFFMLCCCFFCHEACEHCLKRFCCCRNKDE